MVFGKPADNELVYAKRVLGKQENRVAVPAALLTKVNRGPLAYLDRNVTGFTAGDVTELTRTLGKSVDEVAREKGRDVWKLLQPKGASKYADKNNVNYLLSRLTKLHVVRWLKLNPSKVDLKKYDLDDPGMVIKVKLRAAPGGKAETRTYKFGKEIYHDQEGKELKSVPAGGRNPPQRGVYCLADSGVFLARGEEYRAIKDIELRDRTLFRFAPSTVYRLSLEGPDNPKDPTQVITFEVKRDKEHETWITVKPKGFDTDSEKIIPFLINLANLKLTRFVKGPIKPEYGLGKSDKGRPQWTLRIEITQEDEDRPLVLTLGKQVGPDYYAQSSKHGSEVFLVPAVPFQPLFEKPPWTRYFTKPGP